MPNKYKRKSDDLVIENNVMLKNLTKEVGEIKQTNSKQWHTITQNSKDISEIRGGAKVMAIVVPIASGAIAAVVSWFSGKG